MYPVIARDLHLDYGDIGTITGALAIAWGIAALFMGNLSDRIGRRRVLTVVAGGLLAVDRRERTGHRAHRPDRGSRRHGIRRRRLHARQHRRNPGRLAAASAVASTSAFSK